MSILVTDTKGLEFLTFVPGDAGFRPATGSANTSDVSFFWDLLADDLRRLPDTDREAVESVWRGLLQVFAAEMADAAYLDQLKSLVDAPVVRERKWLKYDFVRSVDLATAVEGLVVDLPGSEAFITYPGDGEAVRTEIGLVQGAAPTTVSLPMRSSAASSSALRFSWSGAFSSEDVRGWVFLGYGGEEEEGIVVPGLFVGLSRGGDARLVIVRGVKDATSYDLGSGLDASGDLSVTLWWSGETRQADVLVTDGISTLSWSGVIPWTGSFTRWLVFSPPLGTTGYPQLSGPVKILPGRLTFVDPSLDPRTRFVPSLQPSPSSTQGFLRAGLDYVLKEVEGGRYLAFFEQPETSYYAESVGLDMGILNKIWGPLTGVSQFLDDEDSETLKNQIYGCLAGLTGGPGIGQLSSAVAALTGAPVAMRPGRVVRFFDAAGQPAIVVQEEGRKRAYYYPEGMSPSVSIGEAVQALQPLVRVPRIQSWFDHPRSLDHLPLRNELERASSLLVRIHSASLRSHAGGGSELLEMVRAYLSRALAVWVGVARAFLEVVHPLRDGLDLRDSMSFQARLYLREAFTDALDVRYDDSRGFTFDQDDPPLQFDMDEETLWSDRLVFELTNEGPTDPISVDALGDTYEIADGETVTVSETF